MPSPDRPRVILHIGGAKCGSSAIQSYLARNAAILATRGFGVPGKALDFASHVSGEQIWFFEDGVTSGDLSGICNQVVSLMDQAAERDLSGVVISAENLCNHALLAGLLASALPASEVQVVFYVRRQDDFLISSWQQWNLKRFATLEAFLGERAGRDARWMTMIEPWAEAFGDDRISVRPFIRSQLRSGDIVADFCHVTGISQDGLSPLARNANPSFDEAVARLAHRARDLFDGPHDNRFYDVMARLLGQAALKKGSASSLLDLEARRDILRRYEEENAALKARFLPEVEEASLFAPPTADDVIERSEAEKLSDDIAMLTRAVYALACRMERQKS